LDELDTGSVTGLVVDRVDNRSVRFRENPVRRWATNPVVLGLCWAAPVWLTRTREMERRGLARLGGEGKKI
jgi:hypothetical protein